VENGRFIEKRNAQRRELRSLEEALDLARRSHASKLGQRETAGSQFADAHLMQRDLESRLASARDHQAHAEAQFARWRDLRQERLNASFDQASTIKERIRERSEAQKSLHDSELKIARLEVRLAQTAQRLLDEYAITQEEALARPAVTEAPRETINEVARLRREIRQMGSVNIGAVEEYERLTERYEFLSIQRADLEQARQTIMSTIAEIDESTRGTFLDTFNAVSEEFSRLFGRLFGGGATRLVLTNPEDLLETGIEVIAQPPGKKPQHLSLLSGGERALTAVALLFSFLAVRPSPFVLLDEVDAPLDGANVERFVRLVRDFTDNTQFLIITHNPTTMEAAPRWYGVTMREPGVSSILSYRVPQESVESEPDEAVVLSSA
jgi:chromosome segregation protein